jgi:LuxR family transcriptional regulator, maltose regulon positive regulatory protein
VPKPSPYVLIWLDERERYELHLHGQLQQYFHRGEDDAFSRWLETHTAFAFVGQSGRISALKESRPGGAGYWYAYRTNARRTRKRYLGPSGKVTFARLEQEAQALSGSSSDRHEAPGREGRKLASSPQLEHLSPLLSLRLAPPRLPGSLVERSRLLDELDVAFSHPLTLVSAAAGSGKTTLLSAWVAASPRVLLRGGTRRNSQPRGAEPACAWLSLDEPDNDPIRFWLSVIAALRTCLPSCGEAAQEMLHSPQAPPLSTILSTLLGEIEQVERDIILILDDYHVISDQTIHDSLLALLEHPPTNLHLVLASRTNPELPLARLRVRSQLLEIRDQDLRFTQKEATSFLVGRMGLPLSEEEVATLEARTEGWIAGLQLAALALRKREDLAAAVSDFGGSHRYLLDYLQQDILAHLPGGLQDFLLQTSILTRMNAALCQRVTSTRDEPTCQQMLEELERINLFVVSLDEQRHWYRYHDLFREALRTRLQASQPKRLPLLHLRAAHFYEAHNEWHEAITHALAAADYAYAARLVESAAPTLWLSGEGRTIHSWVFSLPGPVLAAHTPLALDATLHLLSNSINLSNTTLYASLAAQVELTFKRMDQILQSRQELELGEAEAELIQRRLRLLHALIESRGVIQRGDQERLRLLVQETEAQPKDEAPGWKMIPLSFAVWLTVMLRGEGTSLIERLLEEKQAVGEAGDTLITIRLMAWLALAYTQAAQLRLAQQECLEALALIEQTRGHTPLEGYLYYSLFNVSYARNRLEEASRWLKLLQRSAQDWQQVELLVMAEIYAVRLWLATGDLSLAHQALDRLENLVEQEGFANHAPWVTTLRVQLWLAEAHLEEARTWATQATFSPEMWNPLHRWQVLLCVRVLLAEQQYPQAVEQLERFREHLDQSGDIPASLEWMALYAVALQKNGQKEQAVGLATRLAQMARPEGYARLYLDGGEPIIKQAYEILHQHTAGAQRELISPLSLQEQRVLRLLVAGQTYDEMAIALVVSPNTIKTQVGSIYRKLGVSRRAEAIARASQLHLLSPDS